MNGDNSLLSQGDVLEGDALTQPTIGDVNVAVRSLDDSGIG